MRNPDAAGGCTMSGESDSFMAAILSEVAAGEKAGKTCVGPWGADFLSIRGKEAVRRRL